jgi:predicted transcriptional regulator YheO
MVPMETSEKLCMPGLSEDENIDAFLRLLAKIGDGVSATVGEWCEVVVHDLRDFDSSIVFVSGEVTHREVGGHVPARGLFNMRSGRTEPLINYTVHTDDGSTLKSTSIVVHDERGKPVAAFCINLNVTPLLLFQQFLHNMVPGEEAPILATSFSTDLAETVERIIAECGREVGKPISVMSKSDRVQVIRLLDQRGVFQLRKSVPLVSDRLGVTQKTIYNYLAELEHESS